MRKSHRTKRDPKNHGEKTKRPKREMRRGITSWEGEVTKKRHSLLEEVI
jgi:hypothetical protein